LGVPTVLDRELERRGQRFVRYADGCNIYVRSLRAGERVMATVRALPDDLAVLVDVGRLGDTKTGVALTTILLNSLAINW